MKNRQKEKMLILVIVALVSLSCSMPAFIENAVRDVVEEQAPEIAEQAEEIIEQNPTTAQEIQETAEAVAPESAGEVVEQAEETVQELITTITGNDTSMLDSYRTSFSLNGDGSDAAGALMTQSIEMLEEVNRPQSLYHNSIHSAGTGADSYNGDLELFVLDDKTYLYDASSLDYPCVMVGGGMENFEEFGYLRPEDFFESVETGELLESGVTMNGVLTDHYTVTRTGMEMTDIVSETGDIWIAQDGGFIVRYTGFAEGTLDSSEEIDQGKFSWEYNLYDVNQLMAVDLPVECQNQMDKVEEIPVPDNATNKEVIAGIITYESPDSPEQLGDYYREQLPMLGWRITEDSVIASLVMMTAEKTGNSLQIMITTGQSSGSSAIISTIPLE